MAESGQISAIRAPPLPSDEDYEEFVSDFLKDHHSQDLLSHIETYGDANHINYNQPWSYPNLQNMYGNQLNTLHEAPGSQVQQPIQSQGQQPIQYNFTPLFPRGFQIPNPAQEQKRPSLIPYGTTYLPSLAQAIKPEQIYMIPQHNLPTHTWATFGQYSAAQQHAAQQAAQQAAQAQQAGQMPHYYNVLDSGHDLYRPNLRELEGEVDIVISEQPPLEVRTRTPSENRTFGVTLVVTGEYKKYGLTSVQVNLVYAGESSPAPSQTILGGPKVVKIGTEGRVVFDHLCLSEASTKHKEREFCLEFALLTSDGREWFLYKRTRPFYAYSHKRVLSRRRNIKLKTLSKTWGGFQGGDAMHIIGQPFISGPALKVIFRTPYGDVVPKNIELYSDSVIFFSLPSFPHPVAELNEGTLEQKCTVVVTNDGKTMSNELEFTYGFALPSAVKPPSSPLPEKGREHGNTI